MEQIFTFLIKGGTRGHFLLLLKSCHKYFHLSLTVRISKYINDTHLISNKKMLPHFTPYSFVVYSGPIKKNSRHTLCVGLRCPRLNRTRKM